MLCSCTRSREYQTEQDARGWQVYACGREGPFGSGDIRGIFRHVCLWKRNTNQPSTPFYFSTKRSHVVHVRVKLPLSAMARVCGCTRQRPAIMPNQCPTPSFFSGQASILSFFGSGSNAPPSRPAGSVTAKQSPVRKRSPQDSKSSASEDKEEPAITGTSQAAKRRRTKHISGGGGTLDTSGLDGSAGAGVADLACGELIVGVVWIACGGESP